MKFKDCIYYSKKINIGKKKEVRSTIFGFVISCVLVCVFFIFTSLIVYINNSIESNHNLASINLNSLYGSDEFIKENSQYIEQEINYSSNTIVFNSTYDGFHLKDTTYPTITIGNKSVIFKDTYKYGRDNVEYKIINESINVYEDSNFYLDSELEFLRNNNLKDVLLAGRFLTDAPQEIMISSYMLDYFGITDYSSVIGEKISYYNQLSFNRYSYGHVEDGKYINETDKVKDKYYYAFKDFLLNGSVSFYYIQYLL